MIPLFWRGLGIVVLVIPIVVIGFLQLLTDRVFGPGYFAANAWPLRLGGLLSALIILEWGRRLNRRPDASETGPEAPGPRHSLYWIPMEYWSAIILVLVLLLSLAVHEASVPESAH